MSISDNNIIAQRVTAEVEQDEFVVFLIGMRVNKLWKVHKWLPVARAMGRMIDELNTAGNLGLRHVENWFGRTSIMVQYWDSFEQLEAYAKARSAEHLPAWAAFNKAVGSTGDVGIWHETYVAKPGSFECVYNNMPRFGLSRAFNTVPATGTYASAATRMHPPPADDVAA
jgi:fumigallin biosynthesis monooxygenase-like protein